MTWVKSSRTLSLWWTKKKKPHNAQWVKKKIWKFNWFDEFLLLISFSLFRTLCNDTTKQTKVTIVTIPKNPQCDLHVHAYLNQTLIITYYETKHIVQDEKKYNITSYMDRPRHQSYITRSYLPRKLRKNLSQKLVKWNESISRNYLDFFGLDFFHFADFYCVMMIGIY